MAIAVTWFTGEGVACGSILPWLVVVEGEALLAGGALRVVEALAHTI